MTVDAPLPLIIGGERVVTDQTMTISAPRDGRTLGTVC